MLAIGATLSGIGGGPRRRELDSLAMNVLAATRRTWDDRDGAIPVFLLEAWYALGAYVSEWVTPPLLSATWAELHPGGLVLECPDPAELARTEEWLALAGMLSRYDRTTLEALGFFDRDRELLERLIVTLTRTCSDEDLRPLSESVLARIERLVPDLAAGAQSALEIGRIVEGLGRRRWWVPEDIPAPPSTEPVTTSPGHFNREDVDRVLRDL